MDRRRQLAMEASEQRFWEWSLKRNAAFRQWLREQVRFALQELQAIRASR